MDPVISYKDHVVLFVFDKVHETLYFLKGKWCPHSLTQESKVIFQLRLVTQRSLATHSSRTRHCLGTQSPKYSRTKKCEDNVTQQQL